MESNDRLGCRPEPRRRSVGIRVYGSLNDREVKPGQFFRVNITLPFKRHIDPKGSNIMVNARGDSPRDRGGRTKDVIFIQRKN
jgi:hypothetical protein